MKRLESWRAASRVPGSRNSTMEPPPPEVTPHWLNLNFVLVPTNGSRSHVILLPLRVSNIFKNFNKILKSTGFPEF